MKVSHEEPITRETLRSLAGMEGGPFVSVFHPTVRATFQDQQHRDRLKTMLARSEPLLAARGLKRNEIDRFLAPARDLIRDEGFWRQRLDGLAVYIGHGFLKFYRVPFTLTELVEVSDTPCVRPLLPAAATPGHFYVLGISRNQVRLWRGEREELREIDLERLDVPLSLAEALQFDDFERQLGSHATGRADARLQTHSQAAERAGKHVWYGHGSGEERVKEELQRFFGAVDETVCKLLATERAPLIIAAVSYEADLYRLISRYPWISDVAIEGNPDRIHPTDLHAMAWPIAEPLLDESLHAAVGYAEASSSGRASNDLAEVLRAAHEGRVSVLLVQTGAEVWGTYDPATIRTEIHLDPQPLDADLIDLAARKSLIHGGDAYAIAPGEMPCAGAVAALYRFQETGNVVRP